jgi:arabinan endo-1,5-alpha-L-arabinosidase
MTYATGRHIRCGYLAPGSDKWVSGEGIFGADDNPGWIAKYVPGHKGFWAPHAPFAQVLYYSVADDSDGKDIGCIGRATAIGEAPNLVWIDDGEPVLVCDRDYEDEPFAIDPAVFEGKGDTLWMVYGSHWSGIWVVELDAATGHIKDKRARTEGWKQDNPAFYHVASELGFYNQTAEDEEREENFTCGRIEAPYIFRYRDYYYLFVNWGICCSGVESTYEIRVGRSRRAGGPYIDKEGHDMAEGGGSLFLETQGRFIGPGHAGIFAYTDSKGQRRHVFTYHFYDGRDNGKPKMDARELVWDDEGWPVLTDRVFYRKE